MPPAVNITEFAWLFELGFMGSRASPRKATRPDRGLASQIRIVPSRLVVASVRPSGANATHQIRPVCPRSET